MAYYNGFPATYQPMYPAQQYQPPVAQPQQPAQTGSSGLIWVQGEQAAKSYLVAPNSTVQLWDSEEKVIYLKSADASGMPSMKILDYSIRGEATPTAVMPVTEYATKSELNALSEKIREMRDELTGISRRKSSKLLKEDENDE